MHSNEAAFNKSGIFESFWRARRRDLHNLHILNRAVAENGVEITRFVLRIFVSSFTSNLCGFCWCLIMESQEYGFPLHWWEISW